MRCLFACAFCLSGASGASRSFFQVGPSAAALQPPVQKYASSRAAVSVPAAILQKDSAAETVGKPGPAAAVGHFSTASIALLLLAGATGLSVGNRSERRRPVTPRSNSVMQMYGQQQGGYAQQGDPWAVPTFEQGGNGFQQGYGVAQAQWRIDAVAGVAPMPRSSFPALPKYHSLPYFVRSCEDQVLGRCNMMQKTDNVDRVQCMFKVFPDGSPVLIACGNKSPILVRSRSDGGQWAALYKGDRRMLIDGDQVSLDCYNPEGAVFAFADERQGGYGQQMGGQLPPGWTASVDPGSGQTYYCNEQTGQCQWDPPQY